jgi:queuine tRNA-ribosyltransferase
VPRPPPHPDLRFRLEAKEADARATTFETAHGPVRTPAFMPVATRASLKGLTLAQIRAIAPEVLLANTYHLHLRPGEALIDDLGGLHAFTGWDGPILTDSGGYQVFSLTTLAEVTEEGVRLKSHLDGEPLFLGPREAMAVQSALGADLVMAFDHCIALPAEGGALADAVDRTTRWARLCDESRTRADQALFGIVQGGTDEALRARSAADLAALDLPGYAVGGLAVGESDAELWRTLAFTAPRLPADKPRYLMGVGLPPQILRGIAHGIDLFDCVLPTRMGRRGHLFTADGVVRIASKAFERSEEPLDAECACEVCTTHGRAYLRHLFAVGEHSAVTLGTLHNVHFVVTLVRRARAALLAGGFDAFRLAFTARYEAGERAWQARIDADPQGREGSRRARAERDARRRDREPD